MSSSKRLIPKSDACGGALSIGAISKMTGVKVVTLRYYESMGLLPKGSVRRKAGHRRYGEELVPHIHLIRAARGAGMTIPEVKSLLRLLRGFQPPAVALMRELRNVIDQIDDRIIYMQRIKKLLRNVLENPLNPGHGNS